MNLFPSDHGLLQYNANSSKEEGTATLHWQSLDRMLKNSKLDPLCSHISNVICHTSLTYHHVWKYIDGLIKKGLFRKVVKCTISVLSWAEVKIGKVWIDCYIKQQAGSPMHIA